MSFIFNFSQLQTQLSSTSRRICIFLHHWAMAASSGQLQNMKDTWNVNSPTSHEVFLFSLVLWKALILLNSWLKTTIFNNKGQIDGVQNKTIATIIWSIFLWWIYWSLKVSWIETRNSVLQAFYAQTGFLCLSSNP